MKNLNKKIGVVVLSGLVVLGGGLASGSSVFAYQQGGVWIGEQFFGKNPLDKSEYESKWESLLKRDVDEQDLNKLLQIGREAGSSGYQIKAISSSNKHNINVIPYGSNKHGGKVIKYFDDVNSFFNHIWRIGMPNNKDYKICIRGVDYVMRFN